ncbi:unnamed protein product, partial [marine sediment metagenome]
TPWFQLFFIAFQSFVILFTSLEFYDEKRGNKEND